MIRYSPKERRLSDGAPREETFGPEATPGKRGNLSFQREQKMPPRQSRYSFAWSRSPFGGAGRTVRIASLPGDAVIVRYG